MSMRLSRLLVFLSILILLLNGCQTEEDYRGKIFPEADVANPYATIFLEQLQSQESAQEDFAMKLGDNRPVYEYVNVIRTSQLGICYFIPYQYEDRITGAIFYTLACNGQEEEIVPFDKTYLGAAINVDVQHLNDGIGITTRFLYAMPFKRLEDAGLNVDPKLTQWVDLLDNRVIPISNEDAHACLQMETKADGEHVEMIIRYDVYYIGSDYSAVYGLHPEAIVNAFVYGLEAMGVHGFKDAVHHELMQTIVIELPLDAIHSSNLDVFLRELMWGARDRLMDKDFYVSMQGNYTVYRGSTVIGGSGGSHGGGHGGSSGTGGNSGETVETGDNDGEVIIPVYREAIKIDCPNATMMRRNVGRVERFFHQAKADTLGVNTFIAFEDYLRDIDSNRSIEHSTSLIGYPDGNKTVYYLTPTKHGTSHSVSNDVSSSCLLSTMHNHPNGTPPSATDLLFTAEQGIEKENYQATFIYIDSTTYYVLYITDKSKLKELARAIRGDVDPRTNDFRRGGECDDYIKEHANTYRDLSLEAEQQMYRLALIIEKYGKGIAIAKYETENQINVIYDVRKNGILPNDEPNYQPVICQ